MAKDGTGRAGMSGVSLAGDGYERQLITVSAVAIDTRPITPAEIQSHPNLVALVDVTAEFLADQVAARLMEIIGDREPWRQEYVIKLSGWGDQELVMPRYPIETPIADADGQLVPEVVRQAGLTGSFTDQIDADEYEISGDSSGCARILYRDIGWPWTTLGADSVRPDPVAGLETSDIAVGNAAGMGAVGSLTCGYLMPGQLGSNQAGPREGTPSAAVETWQTGTAYGVDQSVSYGDAQGSWVKPLDRSLAFYLECTAAGTSGVGPEPTWNTAVGDTTVEAGGPTWTTRAARELPVLVRQALYMMAALIHKENQGTVCDSGAWGKIFKMLNAACI